MHRITHWCILWDSITVEQRELVKITDVLIEYFYDMV